MKTYTLNQPFVCIAIFIAFLANNTHAQTLTRGPYLQVGKQDSITIRWRTSTATDSKVTWGSSYIATPGTYSNTFTQDGGTPVTEHIVRIGGLSADTKYWYSIGYTGTVLQQTSTNYFLTLPPNNTTRKLRFLAIGDCGNNSTNEVNVKNTFLNYIGSNDVDGMILLGDNAYNSGLDAEFQTNFFDVYKNDLLRNIKLYPAPGNHDYGNSTSNTGNTGTTPALSMPYHLNFTVASNGEIGGVPSYAKNYYSFNIGSVHFISLDSYGKDDGNTTNLYDTTGKQATWLKADLAANTQRWTVVYFHHPPYTKTSHTSDTEMDLVAVREKFIRILERFGVDLVLCGHAHGYERSYLLKGFYNTYASPLLDANFNAALYTATGNTQNGVYDGTTGNYKSFTYNSGQYNHGTVYTVAGSAGQVGGTSSGYPQDCMYYSNATNGGCFYFEVDNNRLDAKFVSYTTAPTPLIRDQFTIFKDVKKKTNYSITVGQSLPVTASWPGTYSWTIPPGDGATPAGQTTRTITVTPNATGTFDYIVADNYGDLKDTFSVTVSAVPLPVVVSAFNATLNNNKVQLDWSTEVEQDNKYFTIDRSTDGVNFQLLGNTDGAVNTNTTHWYHLTDLAPAEGVNYYRLSETSLDGNKRYFDTRRVTYKNGKTLSCLVINQQSGAAKLVISTNKPGKIDCTVNDISGREILRSTYSLPAGNTIKELPLQAGVYIVTLVNAAGEKISNKIIIE
ncbi:MAG: metallophosphoesterase [Bacteroidetes bacterium]|nr:metallophosphoesterase [Bacteroidota bacterium]